MDCIPANPELSQELTALKFPGMTANWANANFRFQMNQTPAIPLIPFSFTLQLGGESLSISGTVPATECPVTDLIPLLLSLGEGVVAAASRQVPSGKPISCGPGCGACCRQLVPISLSEAAYLRHEVLPNLPDDHRLRIKLRLADAASILRTSGLLGELQALPAQTDPARRQAVGLRYFLGGIPCPFLEQESCSIHPQRPLACREYLVVSPVPRCSRPDHGGIESVPIPNKPSHALIQLDAAATRSPGWRTMIEALADDAVVPVRTVPDSIQFLKNFLAMLLK